MNEYKLGKKPQTSGSLGLQNLIGLRESIRSLPQNWGFGSLKSIMCVPSGSLQQDSPSGQAEHSIKDVSRDVLQVEYNQLYKSAGLTDRFLSSLEK